MYEIIISRSAEKFLRGNKVDKNTYATIEKKMYGLKANPLPIGSKKLKGSNCYRIRQGDYRIVYEIRNKVLVIVIINIAHRKNIYKSL